VKLGRTAPIVFGLTLGIGLLLASSGTDAAAGVGSPPAPPRANGKAVGCPAGYQWAQVRITGQRFEEGAIDPKTHLSGPRTLIYNSDPSDLRYVVGVVCIRDLTPAERAAQFAAGSAP